MRRPAVRLVALFVLVGALLGLFVFYGTLEPVPASHDHPDKDDLATAYDDYLGQSAQIGGAVVATDPLVLEVSHEYGTDEYTIQNAPDAAVGQNLVVFGTVQPNNTLEAHDTVVRDSWEQTYMYVISIIGALLVVGRAVPHWRFDTQELGFSPQHGGDRDA